MAWQSTISAAPPVDSFFALSLDMLCTTTLQGRITSVNPAFIETLGYSEARLLAGHFLDLLHPDDRAAAATSIANLAFGKPITCRESRFVCSDGSCKWVTWRSTPSLGDECAYIVAHDRTRQVLADEAMRESEARCALALERTSDAFFLVDRTWRLICVNQQAERLWMQDRGNLLGRTLWDVFPQAVGGPFSKVYEQVMNTGVPAHLEEFYPYAPLNRWFEAHVYASPEGLAVYFRDVTERRQAQDRIRRSVQEKEVLLREVHHRVKNNLQVICSMLRLQARYLDDEKLLQVLRDCRERVLAMAMLHDQLHRAKDLSNINLGEYIRNLAASLFCSYGVNSAEVELNTEIEDITVPIDTAIPCGLIVNELVSNSLRHAFPEGGKGHVSLALHARTAGHVELTVCDDGRGFPEGAPSATRSLGLWLVELLAAQIEALVERSSKAGAAYRITFQVAK
jgi:PAS domain S-box-containing protein